MDKHWTFKVFISERGDDVFEEWLSTLPIKARVKIEKRITYLEIEKRWTRPYFAKLMGYTNLFEIRVVFDSIQYRPIGRKGPGESEFTILVGAIESGDSFVPREALNIADRRSKLIDSNKEKYSNEY